MELKGSEHILIAEDNLVNQRVMQHMLTKMGYSVDLASDGEQAVHMSLLKPYSFILMDMMMPVMDGIAATMAIRKNESGLQRRTLIIAVTANADSTHERRCIDAGMDAFISKPFTFDQLRSSLQQALAFREETFGNSPLNLAILNTFVKTMGEDDLPFICKLPHFSGHSKVEVFG